MTVTVVLRLARPPTVNILETLPSTLCKVVSLNRQYLDDGVAPVHEGDLLALLQQLGILLVQPDLLQEFRCTVSSSTQKKNTTKKQYSWSSHISCQHQAWAQVGACKSGPSA